MISLNKIREAIIRQDSELDEMIALYFVENNLKNKLIENVGSNNEFEIYKESVKNSIKTFIENNKLEQAKVLIEKYKKIINDDPNIYSMEGIVHLQENNLELAYESFVRGLELDNDNVDLLYNIAYINIVLDNKEDAIEYYKKCISITNDKELINEIEEIIHSLIDNDEIETFILLDIDKDDILFKNINLKDKRVINIIQNNALDYEKQYENNGIIIYEAKYEQYINLIKYLIRNNNNPTIICSDYTKYNLLSDLNYENIVYYTNINTFTNKSDYLNANSFRYYENQMCNISKIIITSSINVYIFKKIVEERNNVYLFNNIDEIFDLNNILSTNEAYDENKMDKILKEHLKSIEDEYERALYLLASESNNIDNCIEIVNYIYDKYKTEEMYIIYSSLLGKKDDYIKLIDLLLRSDYCNDIIKAELLYLDAIKEYELIKFINNIQIKDYKNIGNILVESVDYKTALYNFELNQFNIAYKVYLKLVSENSDLSGSPLVNRNISYLMYSIKNRNYKEFYFRYKELLKCLKNYGESDD